MLSDLRQALRVLLTAPAFSTLVVLILAVGIGATSTIFSVVHAVLLRPLPFPEPARLVEVVSILRGDEEDGFSYPDLQDWRAQAKSFSSMAGYSAIALTLTGRGPSQAIQVAATTADLFHVLSARPLRGRTLLPDDDRSKRDVAVISEGMWTQRFARRETAIGERLVLDGRALTIIGVMPASFDFPIQGDRIQAWVPLTAVDLPSQFVATRGAHFLTIVARLSPQATVAQANAELAAVTARLATEYPQSNAGRSAHAYALQERVVGDYQLALLVLVGAVGAVLLIACGNVANLLLVRGTARQREMAIRSALGAPRTRLIRQLLVESLFLSSIAGVLGMAIADAALGALVAGLPFDLPRLHEARLDRTVLLFLTAVSVATGIVFGIAPALQLSAASGETLKDAAHGATGGRSARTRQVLVVAEVALSLVLVASAGLLARSLVSLQHVDPGFVPEHAVGAGMTLPDSQFPDTASRIAFSRRIVERAQQVPGVTAAAVTTMLPLTGNTLNLGFDIEGQPRPPGARLTATFFAVSSDYFRAMGIRLLEGRTFTDHDHERSANVIVVSETMARRYWPAGDAIGKRVTLGYNNTGPREVIGIVADVKNGDLTDKPSPSMYTPFAQTPWPLLGIVVRSDRDPEATVRSLTAMLAGIAPDLPVEDVKVLTAFVARTTATPRFLAASIAAIAGFALLLAGCGLFSVLAYSVAQRRREIGIRMALGAGAADVARHIVGQAVRLGAIGLVLGFAGAIAAGRLFRELLFNTSPADPLTLAAVGGILGAIVLVAAYVPARRAVHISPATVLRGD